jgi:hypothetical protein
MLINVIYQNGRYGLVEDSEIDELIEERKIKKFLRSTGWCMLGADPIRKGPRYDYKRPERRQGVKPSKEPLKLDSFCCGNTKKQKKTRLLRDKAPRNDNSINVRRHCEESSTKQSSLFFCIFLLPQQKLDKRRG